MIYLIDMRINAKKKRPWSPEPKPQQTGRKDDHSKFYNSRAWRKDAKAFLDKHPLCAECRQEGKVTPATVSDHTKPIRLGGDPWSWENRQALCTHHHAVKSGKERHKIERGRG